MKQRDPLDPTMTATELAQLLEAHGVSQLGLARALRVDGRTVRKWLLGEAPIAATVAFAVRWVTMVKHRRALRDAAAPESEQ